MRPFSNFIKRFIRDETGAFQAIEWSFLFMASIVVIMILLPNIVTIGKGLFYSHQIAGYGIQLVAENGQMTEAIAAELETQFANVGIEDYELYGSSSSTIVPYGQPVEVNVITTIHLFPLPDILSFIPNKLKIPVNKVEMSTVYVRS